MISISSRVGLLLLLAGAVLLGITALALLSAVALAGPAAHSGQMSISLPDDYASVVAAMREVCADEEIRGTFEYESDNTIGGANPAESSAAFPRWTGPGEICYKIRAGALSPANFAGSRDKGTVTVRYIVEPAEPAGARVTIDAVFVEGGHHGRHLSQGLVEVAEFGAIAKRLKSAGSNAQTAAARNRSASQPRASATHARAYSLDEDALRRVLRQLGAFEDTALPMLEGFVSLTPEQLAGYDRPHYQFHAAFQPAGDGRTTVEVQARVSARYTPGGAARSEYRDMPSNGRLEADLLDRLDHYILVRTEPSATAAAREPRP